MVIYMRLGCHILESVASREEHTHEHGQFILPLNKPLALRCGGETRYISQNHIGFVPPGLSHSCVCADEAITIDIPCGMIRPCDLQTLTNSNVLPIEGRLIPLVALIKDEVRHDPESDSMRYLYYYLYDKVIENNGVRSIRYMRDHFSEKVSVSELAAIENYNVAYFNDWFKRRTGYTPQNYLRRIRIDKARELLLTTRYSLTDIAQQVGYGSNSALTRAFTDAEGVSPTKWRDMMLNE